MAEEVTTLNTLLESLRRQGSLDSEGTFTLAREKAQDKLRQFQLADPGLYVVQLVATAVAGGASWFLATTSRSRCSFQFDGRPWTKPEIVGLFDSWLETGKVFEGLPELAIGLQAARALGPDEILVESEGVRATIRESQMTVEEIPPLASANRIVVEKGFSLPGLAGRHNELRHLLAVCRHAPLHLTVDGQELSQPFRLNPRLQCAAWCEIRPWQNNIELPVQAPDADHCKITRMQWDLPAAAVVALVPGAAWSRPGVTFVCQGISYGRPGQILGLEEAAALVVAPALRKNLSRSDIVENRDYEVLRTQLHEILLDLVHEVCADPASLSSQQKRLLRRPVTRVQELLLERKDTRRASVIAHFLATQELENKRPGEGDDKYLTLADDLEAQGDHEKAQQLRSRFVALWAVEVERLWRAGFYADAASGLGRIVFWLEQLYGGTEAPTVAAAARALLGALGGEYLSHGTRAVYLAAISRLCGRPDEAVVILRALPPAERDVAAHRQLAELALLRSQPETAERLLVEALDIERSASLLDELALLQSLVAPTRENQMRALAYLTEAANLPHRDAHVQSLRLERLARALSSQLPFAEWVKLRARASFAQLRGIVPRAFRTFTELDMAAWDSSEGPMTDEAIAGRQRALKEAETRSGPNSEYSRYTRLRIAYECRRRNQARLAEQIAARDHVHGYLEPLLVALVQETEVSQPETTIRT